MGCIWSWMKIVSAMKMEFWKTSSVLRSRYAKEKQGFPWAGEARLEKEGPVVGRKRRKVLLVVIEEQGTADPVGPTEGRCAKLSKNLVTRAIAAEGEGVKRMCGWSECWMLDCSLGSRGSKCFQGPKLKVPFTNNFILFKVLLHTLFCPGSKAVQCIGIWNVPHFPSYTTLIALKSKKIKKVSCSCPETWTSKKGTRPYGWSGD